MAAVELLAGWAVGFLRSAELVLGRNWFAMLRRCCYREGLSAIGQTSESLMSPLFTKVAGSHSHRCSMRFLLFYVFYIFLYLCSYLFFHFLLFQFWIIFVHGPEVASSVCKSRTPKPSLLLSVSGG